MASSKLTNFLLLIVMMVTIFTHTYRLGQTYNFHNDEGRDALVAAKMIDTGKPVLLGPQTSVGNMYLGPLYYYAMVPSLALAKMDPIGPAVMVAISGIIATFLIYVLSKRWFGAQAGIVASLFFSITPIMVHFTRSSWNPNLVPLTSILLLLCYDRIKNGPPNKLWAFFFFGILTGALFQLHYVALAFVALLVIAISKNYQLGPKNIVVTMVGFLLITSPFWAFEIRHNLVNTRAFLEFANSSSKGPSDSNYLSRVVDNSTRVVADLVGSRPLTNNYTSPWFILLGMILLISGATWAKAKILGYLIIGSIATTSIISTPIHAHYVGYLFPVVALVIGAASMRPGLLAKAIFTIFAGTYLLLAIPTLRANMLGESSHQAEKGRAVASLIATDSAGSRYNVVAASDNSRESTYAYFLSRLSNKPVTTQENLLYIICEDRPCTEADVNNPSIYSRGPSHPSLSEDLGHPFQMYSNTQKSMVSNTHTVYGVWVARVIISR